uniref:Uncharacterized protein n=1 Tax=Alexandrium monilatum TaxID=311494 RepID=A0A7S4VWK3_9DINO
MLSKCEDFLTFTRRAEGMSEGDVLEELGNKQAAQRISCLDVIHAILPAKLLGVVALTLMFTFSYYNTHCDYAGGFHWWPKPIRLAFSTQFSVLNAMFPNLFPVNMQEGAVWTMPSED